MSSIKSPYVAVLNYIRKSLVPTQVAQGEQRLANAAVIEILTAVAKNAAFGALLPGPVFKALGEVFTTPLGHALTPASKVGNANKVVFLAFARQVGKEWFSSRSNPATYQASRDALLSTAALKFKSMNVSSKLAPVADASEQLAKSIDQNNAQYYVLAKNAWDAYLNGNA